jgi:hypothetical protein
MPPADARVKDEARLDFQDVFQQVAICSRTPQANWLNVCHSL